MYISKFVDIIGIYNRHSEKSCQGFMKKTLEFKIKKALLNKQQGINKKLFLEIFVN